MSPRRNGYQWIFIPRMFALLESGAELPSKNCGVSLFRGKRLKKQKKDFLVELLTLLRELEALLQNQ